MTDAPPTMTPLGAALGEVSNGMSALAQLMSTSPKTQAAGRALDMIATGLGAEGEAIENMNEPLGEAAGSIVGSYLGGTIGTAFGLSTGVSAGLALALFVGTPVGPATIVLGLAGAVILGGIGGEIGGEIGRWSANQWEWAFDHPQICPLVFDLDGDGLELTSRDASSAYFDLDQDGFAEKTGWVSADDGLLAIDLNSDGIINDLSELFGGPGGGFAALATLDSNNDGQITVADAQFSNLRMWQDANGDGFSQSGELATLSALNISAISLTSTVSNTDDNGNNVARLGSFTQNGLTQTVGDIEFHVSQVLTEFVGDNELDPSLLGLPGLRGYGEVKDLLAAATTDGTLRSMLEGMVNNRATYTSYSDIAGDFEALLFRWFGVENASETDRGDFVNGKHLAVLEKLMGVEYSGSLFDDPTAEAGLMLEIGYARLFDSLVVRFLVQIAKYDQVVDMNAAFADLIEDIVADDTITQETVNERVHDAFALREDQPSTAFLQTFSDVGYDFVTDSLTYLVGDLAADLYQAAMDSLYDPSSSATEVSDAWHLFAGVAETFNDSGTQELVEQGRLYFAEFVTTPVKGGSGADTLVGAANGDVLLGMDGADVIDGKAGADVIVGGAGNDSLSGGGGDDTYIFRRGFGVDEIDDYKAAESGWGGRQTIVFDDDILPSELAVSQANGGQDLVIALGSDQISVIEHFTDYTSHAVFEVKFRNGTVWSQADLLALATTPTTGNDSFYGDVTANALSGGAGNDFLAGRQGNDTLSGGLGNDELSGDGGDDTYLFNLGDGQDVIKEFGISTGGEWGGFDTILFGAGITAANVSVSQAANGQNLVLTIVGTTDQITVQDHFVSNDFDVERVVFADSTIWTQSQLLALATTPTSGADNIYGDDQANTLSGSLGDDSLYGREGDDILHGGAGHDTMSGGAGDDTYHFNLGDGHDVIADFAINVVGGWGGTDVVVFGAGISASNIAMSLTNGGNDLLLAVLGTSDSLTVTNFRSNDFDIESFVFADSTVWTEIDISAFFPPEGGSSPPIIGTQDADTLSGTSDAETLQGGLGNDTLQGGTGGDTYRYSSGDGSDLIKDNSPYTSEVDKLWFTNLNAADIVIGRVGNNVTYTDTTTGHVITDEGFFTSTSYNYGIDQVRFADGSTLNRADITDAAWIRGTSSSDTLTGTSDTEIFYGGLGKDTLQGGTGSDTYRYSSGDGSDLIKDNSPYTSEVDKLWFTDLDASEVVISRSGNNVTYTDIATGQTITDEGFFTSTSYNYGIDQVRFGDGSTLNRADITDAAWIRGTSSSDTLTGTSDTEIFYGGLGNDTLQGGTGGDTYRYSSGDGSDLIKDNSPYTSEVDKLWFTDLDASEVVISRSGNNVTYTDIATGQTITDEGFFTSTSYNYGIDQVRFGDGATMSRSEIAAAAWIRGTSAGETLTGTTVADTLYGDGGDDTLNGGNGADAFVFNTGFGHDAISDFSLSGGDVVKFQAGLFNDFADVVAHAAQVGAHTVITYDVDNSLTLWNVQLSALNSADFPF